MRYLKDNVTKERILTIDNQLDWGYDKVGRYDFTKLVGATLNVDGENVPVEKCNSWASLLRSVVKALHNNIESVDDFDIKFDNSMAKLISYLGVGTNVSFSRTLFEDDSYIKSSIYKSNANHNLKIWRNKRICAVYACEVVWVLNSIIFALSDSCHVKLDVRYFKRREVCDVVESSSDEASKLDNLDVVKNYIEKQVFVGGKIINIKVESNINSDVKKRAKKILDNMRKEMDEIYDILG